MAKMVDRNVKRVTEPVSLDPLEPVAEIDAREFERAMSDPAVHAFAEFAEQHVAKLKAERRLPESGATGATGAS